MASSTAAAFIVALRTALQARPGLAGVPVHLIAPVELEQSEFILLSRGRIAGGLEPAAMGRRRRDDSYAIPCLIRVVKDTGAGGSQEENAVFQAAMDRATALFAEVDAQIEASPPAVGDQTIDARTADLAYVPMAESPPSWVVDCEFNVRYRARVS